MALFAVLLPPVTAVLSVGNPPDNVFYNIQAKNDKKYFGQ